MADLFPRAEFRAALARRSGTAARCYQCATCSSVCALAAPGSPFPRRQMLLAQWGLADELAADPAVWLCHHCNDCTSRCPRDARPGDVMQAIRSLMIERLAAPGFLGKLVGNASVTWPLLIGLPFVFWIAFIGAVNGSLDFRYAGPDPFAWRIFVPHWMIYATYLPVTLFVLLAIGLGARRYWALMGRGAGRSGSFASHLGPVIIEILTHRRFDSCETAKPRKTGHLLFVLGFLGAAVTTGLIIVALYGFGYPLPVPLANPMKWIGNLSALLLVVGGLMLVANRIKGGEAAGATTAFDSFFLFVAFMVGLTGALTEIGRLLLSPPAAMWIYISHLAFILCLFATFPYCKFAHIVYRTVAMVHERAASCHQRPTGA